MGECKFCEGSGWVCERHMQKRWENKDGSYCCGGAGTNCVCNPNGEGGFAYVFESIDECDNSNRLN